MSSIGKVDNKDLMLLKMIYEERPSIHEMRRAISANSTNTVALRLGKLEEAGYVIQPAPRLPRSRQLTDLGKTVLKGAGLIHDESEV